MDWTFADSLADPHARHAIMIHAPIVLIPCATALLIAFLATGARHRVLALIAVLALIGASAGAGLAAGSGEEAADQVERAVPPLSAVEHEALERHEQLGEGGWMWPAAVAVVAAPALLKRGKTGRLAWISGSVAVAAGCTATAWVGLAAHAGGELVYRHGLGVPSRTLGDSATTDSDPDS
jgi:uncharacterized membrane protein